MATSGSLTETAERDAALRELAERDAAALSQLDTSGAQAQSMAEQNSQAQPAAQGGGMPSMPNLSSLTSKSPTSATAASGGAASAGTGTGAMSGMGIMGGEAMAGATSATGSAASGTAAAGGASSGMGSAMASAGPWAALAAVIVGHNEWAEKKGLRDGESFKGEYGLTGRALFKDKDYYAERADKAIPGLGDDINIGASLSSPADLFRGETWEGIGKSALKGGMVGGLLKKLF